MGFSDKLLTGDGAILLGLVGRAVYKDAQETKRRKNSPLCFDEVLTQPKFIELAQNIGKRTPRVQNLVVTGMTVTLYVKSISALTTWKAEVDFNDYGRLTGAYWMHKENSDSLIPEHFANAMRTEIKRCRHGEREGSMRPELIAGRYRVLRAIGQGGMGTVWLCRDEVLDRDVAVKQIGAMEGASATEVKRAMREARLAAGLDHPNVVAVHDVVVDDAHPWLVMEYIDGHTLQAELLRDGRLPPARVAELGSQLADALAHAHGRRIVHRDIKPANVLIDKAGRPKISDFGIARGHGDDQLTRTGFLTGTPGFLSPELARGADFEPPSDVWALGATLYVAVEGRPPYESQNNDIALLQAIATGRPRTMIHAGALRPVIEAMMHLDAGRRPDMAACAKRLEAVARDATAYGRRPEPDGRTHVFNMPPGRPTSANGPAAAQPDEPTRRFEPAAAAPPEYRGGGRSWIPIALIALLVAGVGALYPLRHAGGQHSNTKTFSCSADGFSGYVSVSNRSGTIVSYKIKRGKNSGGNSADVTITDGGLTPPRTFHTSEGAQDAAFHALEGPYRRGGGGFSFTFVFDKSHRSDPACSGNEYLPA